MIPSILAAVALLCVLRGSEALPWSFHVLLWRRPKWIISPAGLDSGFSQQQADLFTNHGGQTFSNWAEEVSGNGVKPGLR